MSYALRRGTVADAALLADHRAQVWEEVGGWSAEGMDAHRPVWEAYLRRALAAETYIAYVAEESGVAIGSGAILVQPALPRPGSASELGGRVQSVYVVPSARRRGVARAIMDALVAYARAVPLLSLTLHPSDEARALYLSMGFAVADELVLRLTDA